MYLGSGGRPRVVDATVNRPLLLVTWWWIAAADHCSPTRFFGTVAAARARSERCRRGRVSGHRAPECQARASSDEHGRAGQRRRGSRAGNDVRSAGASSSLTTVRAACCSLHGRCSLCTHAQQAQPPSQPASQPAPSSQLAHQHPYPLYITTKTHRPVASCHYLIQSIHHAGQ